MKKKAYMSPETVAVSMEMLGIIAFSGGDKNNNVKVSNEEDNSDAPNRSRNAFNIWDE